MYYLQNGTAFKAVLSAKLKFIILILAGTLALVGCKDSVEPSGTTNPPPKDTGNETVATPVINPNGGEFSDNIEVTITSTTSIAIIHYTLDGTTPTSGSSVYRTPLTLSDSAELKAIATLAGANDSNVASATFTKTDAPPPANTPPTLSAIANQTVTAGETISFSVSGSDTDGTTPALSADNLPGSATFADQGNGNAAFEWVTTASDVGNTTITVTATDATDPTLTTSVNVTLTVSAEPIATVQAPAISPNGGSFTESQTVTLSTTTTGAEIRYTLDGSAPAAGMGTLYNAPFTVSETATVKAVALSGSNASSISEAAFTITTAANTAPVVNAVAEQTVKSGMTLNFSVTATDAENTIPSLAASNLPTGATFTDQGDASADFSWTPDTVGSFQFTVIATDGDDPGLMSEPVTVTINVTPSGTTPPPADNVLGNVTHYWQFEEGDASSFKNYIDSTTATCSDCPAATAGPFENAEQFNGTSNILSAPYDDRLGWSASSDLTIEAWIKLDGTCLTNETVVGRFDPISTMQWSLGCSNGKAAFSMTDPNGGNVNLSGSAALTDSEWHHIAATRAGNVYRLYVDGIQKATVTTALTGDFIGNAAPLTLGGQTSLNHFMGTLDEVAIHAEALAAARIKQHFKDGEIGLRRGLLGCESNVKITPFGDSITAGKTPNRLTYRPYLYRQLQSGGYDVEYIGRFEDSFDEAVVGFTYDHSFTAVSGASAEWINTTLGRWLNTKDSDSSQLPPSDLYLVHVGTNIHGGPGTPDTDHPDHDLSNPAHRAADVQANVAEMEAMLNGIDESIGEQAVVVLAKIVPNRSSEDAKTYTSEYNAALEAMANRRINDPLIKDRLIVVDQESALNQDADFVNDPKDFLMHPNNDGAEKMSQVWFDSLSEFLPVCTP